MTLVSLDPEKWEWCPGGEGSRRKRKASLARAGRTALCSECGQQAPVGPTNWIGFKLFQRHLRRRAGDAS